MVEYEKSFHNATMGQKDTKAFTEEISRVHSEIQDEYIKFNELIEKRFENIKLKLRKKLESF